ncbi:MAG: MBL fold metallo-hydrolase [Candidatus Eisenbacteria bacterium]
MIWLDPGPDALYWMDALPFDPRHVDALVVSHAHTDHYGNIICTIEAITGATEIKKTKVVIGNSTSLEGAEDSPPLIPGYHRKMILKSVISARAGDAYSFGDIQITALPSDHRETQHTSDSLNWCVDIPVGRRTIQIVQFDGNVFATRDGAPTDVALDDITSFAVDCDILIVNVSNHVRSRNCAQNYVSTDGLLYLARTTNASVIFTTHFGIEMLCISEEEMEALGALGLSSVPEFQATYCQAELKALGRVKPVIIQASDGLRVDITDDTLNLVLDRQPTRRLEW